LEYEKLRLKDKIKNQIKPLQKGKKKIEIKITKTKVEIQKAKRVIL
jgi:hypothetical protein